jgi:WD40 repeat protein/transcriptional regulator with XRE-family HTH domain
VGRSLRIASDKTEEVLASLPIRGFARQQDLADRLTLSRDTISRFLKGQPIDTSNFMEICSVLGFEWQMVAEFSNKRGESQSSKIDKTLIKDVLIEDWDGAPSIKDFYGRQLELDKLKSEIIKNKCRILVLSGLEGVGKTFLATKLAHEIQDGFQALIWRSLRDAPKFSDLRADLFQVFTKNNCEDYVDQDIPEFINYLSKIRCLIILTNVDAVMQDGEGSGNFRPGYEAYNDFLKRLSEQAHKSCAILTSSKIPIVLVSADGPGLPVQIHKIRGLDIESSRKILHSKGISDSINVEIELVNKYQGHPYALQLISSSIQNIFLGSVQEFLASGQFVFNGLRKFLDKQFKSLSPLEISIINWLAINQEPVSESMLYEDIDKIPKATLLESLQSLQRRSFVETKKGGFTLQYFICDYVLNKLIENAFEDIKFQKFNILNRYPLLKSNAQESVRRAQTCLILEPLSKRLLANYGLADTKNRLKNLIQTLKSPEFGRPEYAAGNIFNLLVAIKKMDLLQEKPVLSNYDFSGLPLWQADLRGAALENVNLSNTDLSKSTFYNAHGGILSIDLSHDGTWMAIGDDSRKAYIWKSEKGGLWKPYLTLTEHTHWVRTVSISPCRRYIATGSEDGTVRLWELETGNVVSVLKGYDSRIRSLSFDPTGRYLASGSDDSTIVVWDVETRTRIETWQTSDQRIRSITFSPCGTFVIAASHSGNIYLFDLRLNEKKIFPTDKQIRAITVHPTRPILAIGSDDGYISLWNLENHEFIAEVKIHGDWVRSVTFSPDGKFLATGGEDKMICLLDWENALVCCKVMQGHTSRVWSLAFSPSSNTLMSVSDDQSLKVWNINSGNCLTTFQGYACKVNSVMYSPCGQFIATGSDDHFARIWNIKTGSEHKKFRGHTGRIWVASFTPDGAKLVSASDDKTVKIWDVSSENCIETFSRHSTWVRSVAVSENGQFIASVGDDKNIQLYNVCADDWNTFRPEHKDWILSVCFSPDSKYIATGSDDKTVMVWDVLTKQLIHVFNHDGWVRAVAFSPCGKSLASGCNDSIVRIWDLETASCSRQLLGHKGWVRTVAFNPCQNMLASGGYDQKIILWDLTTGEHRILKGHQEAVISVHFNSTGTALVSGSEDETIKQWDVETGECISTFRVPRPYEKTNITGAIGLSRAERDTFKMLGAFEE